MDENANSSGSENVAVGDALGANGAFLVVERYDSSGNIAGYDRIPVEQSKDLVAGAIAQARQDEVDSGQDGVGASEVDAASQVDVLVCCNIVLVVTVFACLGALCVRTLVKSFEKR